MTRTRNKSDRPSGSPVSKTEPLTKFKDKIETMSGLVGTRDICWACGFMKNVANKTNERIAVIKSLKEATLIPDTYDILMGALSKLSKTDTNPEIQEACLSTFKFHRDRHMFPYKKAV